MAGFTPLNLVKCMSHPSTVHCFLAGCNESLSRFIDIISDIHEEGDSYLAPDTLRISNVVPVPYALIAVWSGLNLTRRTLFCLALSVVSSFSSEYLTRQIK